MISLSHGDDGGSTVEWHADKPDEGMLNAGKGQLLLVWFHWLTNKSMKPGTGPLGTGLLGT